MAQALDVQAAWPEAAALAVPVREAQRGIVKRSLAADEPARARIAKALGLESLDRLEAQMQVRLTNDGPVTLICDSEA